MVIDDPRAGQNWTEADKRAALRLLGGLRSQVHFVGFRGDEYLRAVRIWGVPDFIHIRWDTRARREIAARDVVVFAKGDEHQPPSRYTAPDIIEDLSA